MKISGLFNYKHSESISAYEKGQIWLTNFISIFAIPTLLIAILISLKEEDIITTVVYNSTIIICLITTLSLNYHKKYYLSKLLLLSTLTAAIIVGSILFGHDGFLKFTVIVPISLAFMFFHKVNKWVLYIHTFIIGAFIVVAEIIQYTNIDTDNRVDLAETYLNTLGLISFLLFYTLFQYFYSDILCNQNRINKERIMELKAQEELKEEKLCVLNNEIAAKALLISNIRHELDEIQPEIRKLQEPTVESEVLIKAINKKITKARRELKKADDFEEKLSVANTEFYKRLLEINSTFTQTELKVCTLLKLNFTTKQISEITYQSLRTVEGTRYRIRKKLQLDSKSNLNTHLIELS